MSALAPVDAASCRAMAGECGKQANRYAAMGDAHGALRAIDRARELCILALKFEAEEQNSPSQAAVVTDENLRKPMAAASGQIIREDGDAPQEASDGGNLSDTEFRADAGADITMKHQDIRT